MSNTEQHGADQAGGKEVVYSSDGLDPPPTVLPPPAVLRVKEDTDDALTNESVSAEQAFEVFSGKVYPRGSSSSGGGGVMLQSAETPLQRLGRLQHELEALQTEFTHDNDNQSLETLQSLKQVLEQTRQLVPARQEQLTQNITETVQQLHEQPATSTTRTSSLAETSSSLEKRMTNLEVAVGTSTHTSLSERLGRLETTLSKLDPQQADLMQRRAKTIRQDYEAAAKARNKLLSSSSAADTRQIQDLYNTSQQLQGLSDHLPGLVQRLASLAGQHVDASTWSARLQATEQVATHLQHQLVALEQSAEKLQVSMEQNAATLQENMKALDEQMKK